MNDEVIVFGYLCPVIVKKELIEQDIECHGLFKDNKIYIAKHKDKEIMFHTLLHEMGHALFHRISINQAGIPHELQEIIVDTYATMLLENFKMEKK